MNTGGVKGVVEAMEECEKKFEIIRNDGTDKIVHERGTEREEERDRERKREYNKDKN
jgi:hypothetical protein